MTHNSVYIQFVGTYKHNQLNYEESKENVVLVWLCLSLRGYMNISNFLHENITTNIQQIYC